MNIRDLSYLIAVADHGHFGKAADACFVSQPALSMQIKKLETTLGVTLIERTNKRVFFTEAGLIITQQAREILQQVENLKFLANKAKDPFSGDFRLGIIPTLAPYLLPLIFPQLSVIYPNISFYLIEETTQHLERKLTQGTLDAALLALPIESPFSSIPLFEEEFFVAVPSLHSLAKRKSVNFSDLENMTLLLLEEGHCLRDQALAICQKANALESTNFRATSLETLRHMVASGVGVTLMPALACRPSKGICYLPFESKMTKPTRNIGLVYRSSSSKKILLEGLVQEIKQLKLH